MVITLIYSYLGKSKYNNKERYLRTIDFKENNKSFFVNDALNLEFLELDKREDISKDAEVVRSILRKQKTIRLSVIN